MCSSQKATYVHVSRYDENGFPQEEVSVIGEYVSTCDSIESDLNYLLEINTEEENNN